MPKTDPDQLLEGRRPEEFLNDEQLAEFHRRKVEANPDDKKAAAALRAAKVAAAITSAASE